MKHLLITLLTTGAIFIGSLLIIPFAHALSFELALRHIIYLGRFQQVLGQSLTAIPLAIAVALLLVAAKVRIPQAYVALGAAFASAIGFLIAPSWPSNNLVYIVGELAFVLTAGLLAWGCVWALTTRSRADPPSGFACRRSP